MSTGLHGRAPSLRTMKGMDMLDTLEVYSHSGRLGSAPLVVPLVGIVAGFVLAFVYAYADVYIPIAGWVSFILTLGFAVGVGFSVSAAARMAKCRSAGFLHVAGFLIGLLALYFSWVAFLFVLYRRYASSGQEPGLVDILLNPAVVWANACAIGEEGWYAMRGGNVKGVVLWVFWGIEALVIVIGVTVLAPMGITDRVFCERCNRWCKTTKDFMRLMVPQNDDLLTRFSSGQIDAIAELPVAHVAVSTYLRVDLDRCESCQDTATWRASLVTHERTKEGKIEEKNQDMVAPLLLTPNRLGQLEQYAAREPIEPPSEEGEEASEVVVERATEEGARPTDEETEAVGAEIDEPYIEADDVGSDTELMTHDPEPMTDAYGSIDDDGIEDSEIYDEKGR